MTPRKKGHRRELREFGAVVCGVAVEREETGRRDSATVVGESAMWAVRADWGVDRAVAAERVVRTRSRCRVDPLLRGCMEAMVAGRCGEESYGRAGSAHRWAPWPRAAPS